MVTVHQEHRRRLRDRVTARAECRNNRGAVRNLIIAAGACTALAIPPPAFAIDQAGDKGCADKVSTMDIVDCTAARTKLWDGRLNLAYAALQKFVDPGQRKPLQAAQRSWIQYRDANCSFYGAGDGTISQIRETECQLTMTRDRTLELEAAAKP